MPIIVKRPLARSDLAEIWDYIAEDNEGRADAFVDLHSLTRNSMNWPATPIWDVPVTNLEKTYAAFRSVVTSSFIGPCRKVSKLSASFMAHET